MKKATAEPYRDIDFTGAKRGPVIPAEPGKARISEQAVREELRGKEERPRRGRQAGKPPSGRLAVGS